MIYRRKTYIVEPSFIEEFNQLFNEILLPSQLKYGARLMGDGCSIEMKTILRYSLYGSMTVMKIMKE